MFEIRSLEIKDVKEIIPEKFGDDRGFFSETYNQESFKALGVDLQFVQDNHSLSAEIGVLRGLHYQLPPKAQDKLVRVVKGAIYDVAVDIRRSSPTYGKWVGLEVSAAKWNQILVPKGFAHGFVTLEPGTEVVYKVSDLYSPELDRNIRYDDPSIAISWPDLGSAFKLSEKDRKAPGFGDAETFE
ncbi:dTDP-4-dehydrorhamnose 3,5-epimerase [Limoniibacter endophyticus]|uniref:dTDP-4-dehydrorhamnose 3,5-epimerase n=1 Tax=Limoniibacter endophyticus TaxID=1565040 RepID=A0A8J3GGE3_9HYPH|nr:dTDP-4-dehydrorhamnose 3,5-epimerase [Limoniibacter endophyticus]GHC68097.1 dTDP-4-dehydrorhamnose 3,5-epimerase [Limoniibacter endophyticus]